MMNKSARSILLCALILYALVAAATAVSENKSPGLIKTASAGQGDPVISAIIIVVVLVCCGLVTFFITLLTVLIGRGHLRKAESMGIRSDEVITTLIIWFFLRNLGVHRLYWGKLKLLYFYVILY